MKKWSFIIIKYKSSHRKKENRGKVNVNDSPKVFSLQVQIIFRQASKRLVLLTVGRFAIT